MGGFRVNHGIDEENSWTFGQIVPLILLAAPLAGLLDHFSTPDTSSMRQDLVQVSRNEIDTPASSNISMLPSDTANATSRYVDDYDDSLSFQGAFVLVVVSYIHLAIRLVYPNNGTFFGLLSSFSPVFAVSDPAIQATWVISHLWISNLHISKVRANFILTTIFSALLLQACWQIVGSRGAWFIQEGYVLAMLALPHYVLVTLFFLETCVSKMTPRLTQEGWRLLLLFSLRVAASLAVIGPIVLICVRGLDTVWDWYHPGVPWNRLALQFGVAILAQAAIHSMEWSIQRHKWKCAVVLRGCLIIVLVGATFVVVTTFMYLKIAEEVPSGWEGISGDPLWTLSPVISCTFPVWMTFWGCCDILRRSREGQEHV
jgi:hypothetical protein